MGIRFSCPTGHKLNVKEFLAGKRGVCPECGAKFIIPIPAEEASTEAPQPVGVGQSQSVEVVVSPAPSYQAASAAASPSVIIPITDVDLAPPDVEPPPAVRGSEIPLVVVLPESIVAAAPSLAAPAGAAPEAIYPSPRERSRRNQMIISLLLLALVVLLAGVLIWVLQREVNQTPVEKKTAVRRAELNHVFAMASGGLQLRTHSSVGALKQ